VKITRYRVDGVQDSPPEPLPQQLAREDGALWVDMTGPTEDDLRTLRDVFHFHPLAIEDTLKQRQRPKLEEYEGYFFLTIHAAQPGRERNARLAWDELDIFFGPRYVVTVHPQAVPALEDARARLAHAAPALRAGADYLLYTILDAAVDAYFPVVDRVDAALERLEDQLFRKPSARTLDHIFTLKRTLLQMRRVAAPLRDLLNGLTRRDLPLIQPHTLVYFRDIFDHLLRITDAIDTHRDLITGALDIYLSVISNRLNEVMKVLTVVTAVFASLAVITGVYGMNFARAFPPFDWPYGFAAVLLGMAGVTAVMLALFRRKGWL